MQRVPTQPHPLRQLALILSPYGMKIFTAGAQEVADYLSLRYGTTDLAVVQERFERVIGQLPFAHTVIVGVPNDNGAGFDRGSKKGPLALRTHWLRDTGRYTGWEADGIIDIGDVRDHPLLSDDSYLQTWVIDSVRKDRWGHLGFEAADLDLPVSCLSILRRALECIWQVNPRCRVLILGGDHSKSVVPVQVLAARVEPGSLGVVQFDAHTDLLQQRDGLAGSYATWAWHANEAVGRGGRLAQLGVRISGRTKAYWEESLGIQQYWADECIRLGAESIADRLIAGFERSGVKYVYLSNDIDGLDPRLAGATGTPEPAGLDVEFESAVIERLAAEFEILGSDLMEVAPLLTRHDSEEPDRTVVAATHLIDLQLDAMRASKPNPDFGLVSGTRAPPGREN